MYKFTSSLLALCLYSTATPEPAKTFLWPSSPVKVSVNNFDVPCAWRDGVPWAMGGQLGKVLHTSLPDTSVNLAEVLSEHNYDVRLSKSGDIEARNPKSSLYRSSMDDPRVQAAQKAKYDAEFARPKPPTEAERKSQKASDDATANYEREKRKLEKMEKVLEDWPK